jgi:S1-C subfamily serine protease
MVMAAEFSKELASVVQKVGPSVARVIGRRRVPSSGVFFSTDTLVVASHSVERDEDIEVLPAQGGPIAARVIGRDPTTDLAALRLSAAVPAAVPDWDGKESAAPAPGELALGIARPGRSVRATAGIVSRVAESWRSPLGGRLDLFLETDLAMHPGFSGSALVDVSGRLLGLNTSGILRGVSLAVPRSTVRRVMGSLIARGAVRKGYLGIGTYPVRLSSSPEAAAGQAHGLMVLSVQPESPAARGGLLLGDIIVSLAGERVQSAGDLLPLLDEDAVGTEAVVVVLRAGERRELRVTIGERGAATGQAE